MNYPCCSKIDHANERITGVCLGCLPKQNLVCSKCLAEGHNHNYNQYFRSFNQILYELEVWIDKFKRKEEITKENSVKIQKQQEELLKTNKQQISWLEFCKQLILDQKYEDNELQRLIPTLRRDLEINLIESNLFHIQQKIEFELEENIDKINRMLEAQSMHLQQERCLKLAERYLMIVTSLEKNNYEAFLNLGTILMEQNKHQKAQQKFENAIKLRQDLYEPEFLKGVCLRKQGLFKTALMTLDKAQFKYSAKFQGLNSEIQTEIGKVLLKSQEENRALEKFQKVMDKFPDCEGSYVAKFKYLLKRNQLTDAWSVCCLLLKNMKNSKIGLYYQGVLLLRQGRNQEAKETFLKLCNMEQIRDNSQLNYIAQPSERLNSEEISARRCNQLFLNKK